MEYGVKGKFITAVKLGKGLLLQLLFYMIFRQGLRLSVQGYSTRDEENARSL